MLVSFINGPLLNHELSIIVDSHSWTARNEFGTAYPCDF